jgi:DNA-binding PadR family transcriptional regulator
VRHVAAQSQPPDSKPLTEPVLLILLSLAGKPRHGYALMKDIETLSNGRVQLSTGTMYGALRRLLVESWIERFSQDDTSRDKQAYRLTPAGRKQLELELGRMKDLTRIATARLRTSEA